MFIYGEGGQQDNSLVVVPEAQDVLLFLLDGFVSGVGDFRQRASLKIPEAGLHSLNGRKIVLLRVDFGSHVNDGSILCVYAAAGKAQHQSAEQNTGKHFPHTITSMDFAYHTIYFPRRCGGFVNTCLGSI